MKEEIHCSWHRIQVFYCVLKKLTITTLLTPLVNHIQQRMRPVRSYAVLSAANHSQTGVRHIFCRWAEQRWIGNTAHTGYSQPCLDMKKIHCTRLDCELYLPLTWSETEHLNPRLIKLSRQIY